jgi:hypothetical protein
MLRAEFQPGKGLVMHHGRLFGATVLSALLCSTAASAQMTAQQVWDNWKAMSAAAGQTLTPASESMSGDTLTVTGIDMTSTFESGSARGRIEEIRFREMGDGRVEVTMSPTYTMTIDSINPEGKPVSVGLSVNQTGFSMIAGGGAEQSTYDFTAASIAVATTGITEDGVSQPASVSFSGNGLNGSYATTRKPGDIFDVNASLSFGDVALSVVANDTEAQSDLALKAAVQAVTISSSGTYGKGVMLDDVVKALDAGFRTETQIGYGPTQFSVDINDTNGTTTANGSNGGGSIALAMDKGRLAYSGGSKNVDISVSGSQIPFPQVRLAYAESLFDLLMPISAAPDPQKFGLTVRAIGLTVSDEVWGLVDPMATIPRDPATLILETSGTAKLNVNIMDEAAMAAAGDAPGTLESLDMPALQLTIGGAELTGSGALTFDNSDRVTFGGMPAPTGKIDLKLVGGNGLLDKLIALGLVPEEQAMGIRMGMGMFARPGDGPDSLTSTIEFRDKGLFANGMQLQ